MLFQGSFGCAVETALNRSNLGDGHCGCGNQAPQQGTAKDFCTITISLSDSVCQSSSVSSAALLGIVWALLTGGILLSGFFLVFTVRFRKNRIVKMSSPNLNVVTLLGSSLTYGSVYLFGIEKQNPWSGPSVEMLVQVKICLLCIGGSLIFGPILGKSWRLYKVFTQRVPDKRVIIKDLQLLVMVGALVGADIVLLSTWIFLDPVQCLQSLNADLKVTEKGLTCVVSQGYSCVSSYSDLWLILFLGFKGIFLMYGAYLAGLTYNVSSPPVNQSLTLIVGIAVVFLSAQIILVVNRFFHSWHNLVFGTTSGGILVCTTTINGLIFTPQVRQRRAFDNLNENIGHVAKYFTSSSKNFYSTVCSEEEICQLIGEKNAMMQLLAEKDTAIASLQEQVNSAKEELTRLVAAEDGQEAVDSPFPSASGWLQKNSSANCSSKTPEDTPGDLNLPGPEQNSYQYYPKFSHPWCIPGSSNKHDRVGDLERTNPHHVPLEITDSCQLLNSAKNISDCSGCPGDHENWLFQYTSPLRENASTPRVGAQQSQVRKQLPGTRYISSNKPHEVLQERRVEHKAGSQTSPRGPEQSPACERSTGWEPQEIQATILTRLGPYGTREDGRIPTCLPGSMVPGPWCVVDRTIRGGPLPWAAASDAREGNPMHQRYTFPASACQSRPRHKGENWVEQPGSGESSRQLGKRPMGNGAPVLCPGHPRTLGLQQRCFAGQTAHLFQDSDSGSSTSSSGGAICCPHRHCCELSHHSWSSSSDSCSTNTVSEPDLSLHSCANWFGKPQPVVNFNEDLEPIYV